MFDLAFGGCHLTSDCYRRGKNRQYHNLAPCDIAHTTFFDENDAAVCDAQIGQFLNATRELDLKEKRKHIKFHTKAGVRKRALNTAEWDRVSAKLGMTSVLSLLYRKRVKANYADIYTYLSPHLDVAAAYGDLMQIVGRLNFVHERFIRRGLGHAFFNKALAAADARGYGFLRARAERSVASCGLTIAWSRQALGTALICVIKHSMLEA